MRWSILESIFYRQALWSDRTFGPPSHRGPLGPLDHLKKELEKELIPDPTNLGEYVDVYLLLTDGLRRAGHTWVDFEAAVVAKQELNEKREWPDWRTADPIKAIEHIRRPGKEAL